jgi:hypothetical protein
MLRSCGNSQYISFPLKTSISDLKSYYSSISQQKPNITATYTPRLTNPNFKDQARTTGEIDESMNSMIVTYNNITYTLHSAQLCLSTHTDWLDKNFNNKIDIICTFENTKDLDPRFVIIVVPLIIDNSITVNNPYLLGLSYMSQDSNYSLQTIFNGLNDFVFYTTCLEPHGDNAFVYVNTDGLKITQDLYNELLAVWTNQDLNTIQQKIQDNVAPLKTNLKDLFSKIQQSSDIQDIQKQISNIQSVAQTPVINNLVETWPKYTPPYDIVLNVPSKVITVPTSSEGFQNIESFQVGSTSSGGLSGGGTSGANGTSDGTVLTTTESDNSIKCVPLDLDNAIDASGNINFDADGNILLSNIASQRTTQTSTNNTTNLAKYLSIIIGVLIGIGIVIYAIYYLIDMIKIEFGPHRLPALPSQTPHIGFFIIIGLIIGFCGFLIGAFTK